MQVTAAEFVRKFGVYADLALNHPVVITKNGRERLVVLSVDEYNLLRHISDAYRDLQTKQTGESAPAADGSRKAIVGRDQNAG